MKVIPERILRLMSAEDRKSLGKAGTTWNEALAEGEAKSERELQRQIIQFLRLKAIEACWHRTDKKSAATIGWPDITFACQGIPVAWEVKMPTGKLSKEQETIAATLQTPVNGWRYSIITSFDQARAELKAMGV